MTRTMICQKQDTTKDSKVLCSSGLRIKLKEPFVIWEKSTFIFNLAVDIWVQLCFHLFEMGSLNDNLKVEDY